MLLEHLRRRRPAQLTKWESAFASCPARMDQVSFLADDPNPECVWRKGGRCADLFAFLVDRFGGAPDSVIDCEGKHAEWQMLVANRRALKFKLLNAMLKLRAFITVNGGLPDWADLQPHFDAVRAGMVLQYRQAINDPNVRRARADWVYAARFNLRAVDVPLIRGRVEAAPAPILPVQEKRRIQWGNYLRFLFFKQHLYRCSALREQRYFYVAENKSMAYKEHEEESLAQGRPISVIWYEPAAEDDGDAGPGELVVLPCDVDDDGSHLGVQETTVAELCRTAGHYLTPGPEETERQLELRYEASFLDLKVECVAYRRLPLGRAGRTWALAVQEGSCADVEEHAFTTKPLADITRLALARRLILRDGLEDRHLWRLADMQKNVLIAVLETAPAPGGVDAAIAVAKAAAGVAVRGRGRGGPAVVPRGRGRGGAAVVPPGRGRGAAPRGGRRGRGGRG